MTTHKPSVITITAQDLPLICTGPEHETWNGHPRVFHPLSPTAIFSVHIAVPNTILKGYW